MEAAFPSTKPCGLHSTGSSWPPCVLAILQRGKWRLQTPRATQGVQESRTFYHEVLGAGASQTPAPMPPFPSQEGRTPSLSALLPPHRGFSPLGLSQGHPFPAKSGQLRCGLCGWRGRRGSRSVPRIPQDLCPYPLRSGPASVHRSSWFRRRPHRTCQMWPGQGGIGQSHPQAPRHPEGGWKWVLEPESLSSHPPPFLPGCPVQTA